MDICGVFLKMMPAEMSAII